MLLQVLRNVRRASDGYRADCPNGHKKTRGSLTLAEGHDGRVLLHCFACSDTQAILGVLGLEMADLFPERVNHPSPEARRAAQAAFKRSAWSAALGVLSLEATILLLAAAELRRGNVLPPEDEARVALAVERIDMARGVLR